MNKAGRRLLDEIKQLYNLLEALGMKETHYVVFRPLARKLNATPRDVSETIDITLAYAYYLNRTRAIVARKATVIDGAT